MVKNIKHNDNDKELKDFPIDVKKKILDIINDTPSLVRLGDKEYKVKNLRYYSLHRIFSLAAKMKKNDEKLDSDNKILSALCTDIDAMCEIVAIVLCNHLFTADGDKLTFNKAMTRNDYYISVMKAKVMNSYFDTNQLAAIILGALKSSDLIGFFLTRESVNTLMDSTMERKKKSVETASQFMAALSLQTQATSLEPSPNTD